MTFCCKHFARFALKLGLNAGLTLSLGLGLGAAARGQAVPAASRSPVYGLFRLPTVSGSLRFSVTASERLTLGYGGGGATNSAASLSGNVAFLSKSVARPFSLVYSGGYLANTSQQPSSFFHHLTMSEVINTGKWNFSVSDDASYLPETATTGRSGVPGVGDAADPFSDGAQEVLTRFATRIDNKLSGSATRKMTGKTQVNGQATYSVGRFLSTSTALETNQQTYSAGVTHRLNARSNVDANYQFGYFTYVAVPGSFTTQGLSLQYARQLTRKVKLDVSLGPQRVDGESLTGTKPSINYTANANLAYTGQAADGELSYTRATNSGSGVTLGARTDTLRLNGSRPLTRASSVSASLSYSHTSSLDRQTLSPFSNNALLSSVQGTRVFHSDFSAYVSYSAQRQSTSGIDVSGLSTSGVSQFIAFGVTYSPRLIRFSGH